MKRPHFNNYKYYTSYLGDLEKYADHLEKQLEDYKKSDSMKYVKDLEQELQSLEKKYTNLLETYENTYKELQRLRELLKKADLRILRDYRGRERIGTAIEWTPTDDERKLIQELNEKEDEDKQS